MIPGSSAEYRNFSAARSGGTAVDIRFHQLMAHHFGEAFLSIDQRLKGPGSRFSKDFEQNKRKFGHHERQPDPMRLTMNVARSERYEPGRVFVTNVDLEACFKPVVERIKLFVETQLESARQAHDLQISKVCPKSWAHLISHTY
jgi:hypothetical protein